MRYGHFDDERREYVIERPDTPLPWINYLGTSAYFGIISNTAGGYSLYRDARLRRITRYRYNNVPLDFGGRYLYFRNNSTGEFWSPSWQPVRADLDFYECRHGLSYTQISSRKGDVSSKILYFVPLGENLEVWRVEITNDGNKTLDLSVFSLVEFCLWDAQDDSTNFQRNFSTGEVEVSGSTIYHKTEYRERRNHFAYFACSEPLDGFDTQREDFLGPYRGWDNPLVVETGRSTCSLASGWAPIGSHHVRMLLDKGASRQIVVLLGYWENPIDEKFDPPDSQQINKRYVLPVIERWLRLDTVEEGFRALRRFWDEKLGSLQVETPDPHVNRMVNIWNQYQCMVTFNMSRSASYFESGIGRGMGFRDSNQDLLGFVHMIPGKARERICDLASTQLSNGAAYHQYQPLTKRGNNDIGSGFNDDPLWLVLAAAAYLKETGDLSILTKRVPFDSTPGTEAPIYEHLRRSIYYTLERRGPHHLPLIGRADWNDCLNLNCFSETPGESFQTTENRAGGVAESLFIGGLFVIAAREMTKIAALAGKEEDASEYRRAADEMVQACLAYGWDGDWFLRAYDYFGEPVGTHRDREGQIFIEPQGICVMAGIGVDDGKAVKALDSVAKRLAQEHGIALLDPPYAGYRVRLGEISSYPPGYKENGAVFCHTNPWIMIAEALIGRGDRAFDYYMRINPSFREAISEVHRCEPYVYAQMIASRHAPRAGEAKNSWLTGTAAWNLVAISQWILGIRPDYEGLLVDPVLPASWGGFFMRRVFRGATYEISVFKEPGTTGRVSRLVVDGTTLEHNLIPPVPSGSVVKVDATIE
jgi:cellobiose phosphorylase